jgi:NTE family protein
MKIGLALGSGGAKGLAHIGVLKVFEKYNLNIDIISGTSIGAVIGALYSMGMSASEIEKLALSIGEKNMKEVFSTKLSMQGILNQKKALDFLDSVFNKGKIEELPYKFICVATDIMTGEEIVFKTGELSKAVMASASIPVFFPPLKYKNHYLNDGGLINPVPIKQLMDEDIDFIIAVDVSKPVKTKSSVKVKTTEENMDNKSFMDKITTLFSNMFEKEKDDEPNIIKVFLNSIDIMEEQIVKKNLRVYPPDILISPDIQEFKTFDFDKVKEIIGKGEIVTEKIIDYIIYRMELSG